MTDLLGEAIKKYAVPYETNAELSSVIDAIGNAKIVLLGEASHGTSEFYTTRNEISKRLIEEKGFSMIAVEGDWTAARNVNRFIKGYENENLKAEDALKAFDRWPTWMWNNKEVTNIVDWLKMHNDQPQTKTKVGFYGIDLYSMWESMDETLQYLTEADPTGIDLEHAKKVVSCFEPFNRLSEHYAMSTAHFSQTCTEETEALLSSIQKNEHLYPTEYEQRLNLKMNALVTRNAEKYYRISLKNDTRSWNIRDEHMIEVIHELQKSQTDDVKIIVWEHNTHIGDARATTMNEEGMLNVGQLLREQHPEKAVYAIGFGTYQGTVVAAEKWGEPFEVMEVPPAKKHSWENLLHETGAYNKILFFTEDNRQYFNKWIGHRAIGVVYNPAFESYGNYVPSIIGKRYDAFIYIDETTALTPHSEKPNTNK